MRTNAGVRGLAGSIAVIALVCLGNAAIAQQKLILKASDVHPAGYPTVVAVENLGKKLETGGKNLLRAVNAKREKSIITVVRAVNGSSETDSE